MTQLYFIKPSNQSTEILIDISYFIEGAYSFLFEDVTIFSTGDVNDINMLKECLAQSDLIILNGEMDRRSYFELGLCSGLGKDIYVMDDSLTFDSKELALEMDIKIKVISFTEFIEMVNTDE
ncbi:hypothetical protein [Vagococcus sp.]|uniref:hypothetical protein n=1 Tax=Vagococcus sp. TaxID=1933889 RepID=UPI002FC689FE